MTIEVFSSRIKRIVSPDGEIWLDTTDFEIVAKDLILIIKLLFKLVKFKLKIW